MIDRELLPVVFDFLGVPDPEAPAIELEAEARERLKSENKRVVAWGAGAKAVGFLNMLKITDRPTRALYVARKCSCLFLDSMKHPGKISPM